MKKFLFALLALLWVTPASAAYQFEDITCEQTTTAGTGTVDLPAVGLTGGYLPFVTTITSGATVPYNIITGSGGTRKIETGDGVFTDGAPDTLTRVAAWSSDGVGAELTLAGTSTVCLGWNTDTFTAGVFAPQFAGVDIRSTAVGPLRFYENSGTGSDFLGFIAPTSITTSATCTLEDDSSMIPDACVGDGSDAGGAGSQTPWTSNIDANDFTLTEVSKIVISPSGTAFDNGSTDAGLQINGTSLPSTSASINRFSADATGPRLSMYKSRDAIDTITTSLSADDELGFLIFLGTETTGVSDNGAEMTVYADGAWGSAGDTSDTPTRFEFKTAADGTDSVTTRMSIRSAGGVIVGAGTTGQAAGDLTVGDDLIVGGTTTLDLGDLNPSVQVHGVDTSGSSLGVVQFSADAIGPKIMLVKSHDGTIGTFTTLLSNNDELGSIFFGGTEETSVFEDGAAIGGYADGTWGDDATDSPARIEFKTTVDGSASPATRMTIKGDGGLIVGSGTTSPGAGVISSAGLVVNHTGLLSTWEASGVTPGIQGLDTSFNKARIALARFATNSNVGGVLILGKSAGATIGTYDVMTSGDDIGSIEFQASDSVDMALAGRIMGEVDGTPGSGDMPGRIIFQTSPDASEAPATRMTIKADGGVIVGSGNTSCGANCLLLTAVTTGAESLNIPSGTVMTTPDDGAIEADADVFYGTTDAGNRGVIANKQFIRAEATRTFTSNTSQQNIFTSPTNGRLTLEAGTYRFEGVINMNTMSATSGNGVMDLQNGGTSTLSAINWVACGSDAAAGVATASGCSHHLTDITGANILVAATGATLGLWVAGTFEATAGTIIPSFAQTTAAAAVVQIGSYMMFERIGSATVVSVGQWD